MELAKPLYDRLKLDESTLKSAFAGVRDVRNSLTRRVRANSPEWIQEEFLKRITCPLGVLGIILKRAPKLLIQIVSLAIKSGNGVILKGGKEAVRSCEILTK